MVLQLWLFKAQSCQLYSFSCMAMLHCDRSDSRQWWIFQQGGFLSQDRGFVQSLASAKGAEMVRAEPQQGWCWWLHLLCGAGLGSLAPGCMVAVTRSGPSDAMLLAEPSLIIPPPQWGTRRGHTLVIPTGASRQSL